MQQREDEGSVIALNFQIERLPSQNSGSRPRKSWLKETVAPSSQLLCHSLSLQTFRLSIPARTFSPFNPQNSTFAAPETTVRQTDHAALKMPTSAAEFASLPELVQCLADHVRASPFPFFSLLARHSRIEGCLGTIGLLADPIASLDLQLQTARQALPRQQDLLRRDHTPPLPRPQDHRKQICGPRRHGAHPTPSWTCQEACCDGLQRPPTGPPLRRCADAVWHAPPGEFHVSHVVEGVMIEAQTAGTDVDLVGPASRWGPPP